MKSKSISGKFQQFLIMYEKTLRIDIAKLHDGELIYGGRQFLTLFEKKSGASQKSLAHKTAASVSWEQPLFPALRLMTTLFSAMMQRSHLGSSINDSWEIDFDFKILNNLLIFIWWYNEGLLMLISVLIEYFDDVYFETSCWKRALG